MGSAQLVSAVVAGVAALLAATLSGFTLWTTGRRDERKWRREALLDTIVSFLDGSFGLPGNQAYNRLRGGGSLTELQDSAASLFRQSATALTRLRILAPSTVVTAAEHVHDIDDQVVAALLMSGVCPSVQDWLQLTDERRLARTSFLDAARLALDLGPSKPLVASRYRPQPD